MILHWNGHFEPFLHFKRNQTIQSMLVVGLARCAEKHWRRLNGAALLPQVIQGVTFVDGLKKETA